MNIALEGHCLLIDVSGENQCDSVDVILLDDQRKQVRKGQLVFQSLDHAELTFERRSSRSGFWRRILAAGWNRLQISGNVQKENHSSTVAHSMSSEPPLSGSLR